VTSPHERSTHSLLRDDALVVRTDAALAASVGSWLPLHAAPPGRSEPRATIDVVTDESGQTPRGLSPSGDALLRFGGVQVHASDGDMLRLVGASAARGRIDLAAKRATISAAATESVTSPGAFDVYSMLTLSAAFLVGRLGGALVHAGAVVDPDGRAWLLVGDTHAGKTTTCVSLVARGGWRWLADDQVVLRRDADASVVVEGWPRAAHLDEGWSDGAVTGRRASVDLRDRWGERWLARAPLGGIILPAVRAGDPTSARSADGALALTALVRQSPWLMADRGAAPAVLALLRDAASRPALALSVGRDCYARGDLLAERLAPALERSSAR